MFSSFLVCLLHLLHDKKLLLVQKEEDLQYEEKRDCILLPNDLLDFSFLVFRCFFLHTSLDERDSGADPTVMLLLNQSVTEDVQKERER